MFQKCLIFLLLPLTAVHAAEVDFALPEGVEVGEVAYHTPMDTAESVKDWVMEGPGKIEFTDGWMKIHSPGEEMHHVFWCPETFPSDFVASWEVKNVHPEAGLLIVFFAAMGLNGEDALDPSLPKRDGTFNQYHSGALRNYHISYYANTPGTPARPTSHLRKNPGFTIVAEGPPGIAADSTEIHRVVLIKDGAHVRLLVDGKSIIDYRDDGSVAGPPHGGGRIALRQMQWSQFLYRDFGVWALKK
jgi:Domain of unknown function (DUF1961)